jgi:hypothetical protein
VADRPKRDLLAELESAFIERLGTQPERASVSFVGVDAIEVLRWSRRRPTTSITLGMARNSMGETGRRAELSVDLHGSGGESWRQLAVLAAAPVVEAVVYSLGMTVDLGAPIDTSSLCVGGLIVLSDLGIIATESGDVSVLRVIPATANELAFSRLKGSAALQERWHQARTDLLDLGRCGVELN